MRSLFKCWRQATALALGLGLGWILGIAVYPHPALFTRVPLSKAVYANDGSLMRLTLATDGQYRLWTPLAKIAPTLVQATLLYEDQHFFKHAGVNPFPPCAP